MKKIIITTVILLISFSKVSNAGLESLLSGVSSYSTKAEAWKAAGRQGYYGGRGGINFQQKNINLLNIQAPSISDDGCGNISWTLGGLSVIDGEEFVQFLQATAQSLAPMFIISAIKSACKECANTISYLQDQAQKFSGMSLNSCRAAQSLLDTGEDLVSGEWAQNLCAKQKVAKGDAGDIKEASSSSGCSTSNVGALFQTLKDNYAGDDSKKEAILDMVSKNSVWDILKLSGKIPESVEGKMPGALNYDEKLAVMNAELTMSLYGTYSYGKKVEPILKPTEVFKLMICGSDEWNDAALTDEKNKSFKDYCSGFKAAELKIKVFSCSDDLTDCGATTSTADSVSIKKVNPIGGDWSGEELIANGFSRSITEAYKKAFDNIDNNLPPHDDNNFLLTIMKMVPFDLYRVLNLYEAYPDAAKSLLLNSAFLTATSLAKEYISQFTTMKIMKNTMVNGKPVAKPINISKALRKDMEYAMKEIEKESLEIQYAIVNELDYQDSIMLKVSTLEEKSKRDNFNSNRAMGINFISDKVIQEIKDRNN